MNPLCEGRVVVVTGAGRGIGREYALQLARHGARVVVNDLGGAASGDGEDAGPAAEVVALIRAAGGQAVANGDDIGTWDGAARVVSQAIAQFGRLDVVVNNAGNLRDRMIATMSEQEWDAVVNVHLKGSFALARHAAAYWRDRYKETGQPVDGRIINTTSASGVFGNVGQSNYGAAKAGVAALTVIAARELRRYGVTVNAICPHAQTRMTENLREKSAAEIAALDPRWIAPVVVWLASAASGAVSGRVLEVGGGVLSVLEGWRRGPVAEPVADPALLGELLPSLVAQARPNVGMKGQPLDI